MQLPRAYATRAFATNHLGHAGHVLLNTQLTSLGTGVTAIYNLLNIHDIDDDRLIRALLYFGIEQHDLRLHRATKQHKLLRFLHIPGITVEVVAHLHFHQSVPGFFEQLSQMLGGIQRQSWYSVEANTNQ